MVIVYKHSVKNINSQYPIISDSLNIKGLIQRSVSNYKVIENIRVQFTTHK